MERLTGQRIQYRHLRFGFGESVHVKRNPDITNTLQSRVYDCIALYPVSPTASEWFFLSLDTSPWQEIRRPVRDAIVMPFTQEKINKINKVADHSNLGLDLHR